MSSTQIVAPYRRIPHLLVAGIVAAAFALGTVTGFGVPRLLDGADHAAGASVAGQAIKSAADNNMTDAVLRARTGSTPAIEAFKSVADNNMTDAVLRATGH